MRDTDLSVSNEPCKLCGRNDRRVRVYRDPFGETRAPGRWPNLTMHSDCFLTYIKQRKSARQVVDPQMGDRRRSANEHLPVRGPATS
jgi:hypothetical protein